jgi:hypothetical protein
MGNGYLHSIFHLDSINLGRNHLDKLFGECFLSFFLEIMRTVVFFRKTMHATESNLAFSTRKIG